MFLLKVAATILWFMTGWAASDAIDDKPNPEWASFAVSPGWVAFIIGICAILVSVMAAVTKDE